MHWYTCKCLLNTLERAIEQLAGCLKVGVVNKSSSDERKFDEAWYSGVNKSSSDERKSDEAWSCALI